MFLLNGYRVFLLRLEEDIGGREIIDRHPDGVLEVAVNCEGVCFDIDTTGALYLEGSKSK
jgi:CTP:molybdopterin cytidylyltransferase MocA